MIRRFVPFISLLGVMALALAQNPPTRPQAAASPQPEDVIRINVNLVQVDALVTDAQGNLVEDLKKEDFEIRQDGKPQAITNFSYINTRPGPPAAPPPPPARGKKPANNPGAPPPVPVRASQARRTFAFVVDDLALAAENVPAVRSALEKFVDVEMQPGDIAAVIRTGSGMGALEQFTTDKRVLHLAINRIRFNAMGRVGISSFGGGGGGLNGLSAMAAADRRSNLNAASLQAITTVVNGLRELPGRKTVILFTEDLRIMSGGAVDPRAQSEYNRLSDAASRSSVVISSIDPRGLQTLALTAADHPRSAANAASIPMRRSTQMFNSQDGMGMEAALAALRGWSAAVSARVCKPRGSMLEITTEERLAASDSRLYSLCARGSTAPPLMMRRSSVNRITVLRPGNSLSPLTTVVMACRLAALRLLRRSAAAMALNPFSPPPPPPKLLIPTRPMALNRMRLMARWSTRLSVVNCSSAPIPEPVRITAAMSPGCISTSTNFSRAERTAGTFSAARARSSTTNANVRRAWLARTGTGGGAPGLLAGFLPRAGGGGGAAGGPGRVLMYEKLVMACGLPSWRISKSSFFRSSTRLPCASVTRASTCTRLTLMRITSSGCGDAAACGRVGGFCAKASAMTPRSEMNGTNRLIIAELLSLGSSLACER